MIYDPHPRTHGPSCFDLSSYPLNDKSIQRATPDRARCRGAISNEIHEMRRLIRLLAEKYFFSILPTYREGEISIPIVFV